MGGHYGSIHVRTDDSDAVQSAVHEIAREQKLRFLVAPAINRWVSVFPEHNGQNAAVSEDLAGRLGEMELIHCLVHDDDVFAYWYFQNGTLKDRYNSCPDYFGEKNPEPRGGSAQALAHLLPGVGKIPQLQSLLDADSFDFEMERFDRFARLLGLPNAVTAYEYLQDGERDGIKHWRKFAHVPDRSAEKAARKAGAARLRAELKRLKAERVLLVDQVAEKSTNQHFGQHPVWTVNPAAPEVLVAWGDAFDHTMGRKPWTRHGPPEWTPEPMDFTASTKAHRALFSHSGRWLAVSNASGQWSAEVWDWPTRTRRAEPTFNAIASTIAFNSDESRLFAVSNNTLHSIPLVEGETRSTVPIACRQCNGLAVHPRGQWVALEYDGMLGLLDLTTAESVLLFGIGGLLDYAPVMAQMFDDASVQRMMSEMAKILPPEQVEKYREDLLRQRQQSYRGKEQLRLVHFSADGHWLICGTQEGVRVFDWNRLRTSRDAGPTPDFAAETDAKISDDEDEVGAGRKYVYAVAFDEGKQRVLFGGLGGKVRYLDLLSGLSGDLLELRDGLSVMQLAVTSDRSAVVLTRTPMSRDSKRRARFQIWSYPQLCATAGIPH